MSASTASPAPVPRGRPRDPRRDAAIVEAATALLAEVGYDRMTIDAVAARAGVSKPTIYRRWAGKQELIVEAIRSHPSVTGPLPDTGSLRGDLLATVRDLAARQLEDAPRAAGLGCHMRESPELAALIRDHAVEAVRGRFDTVVARAVERGELPADPPVTRLFADVAPAVLHSRIVFLLEPVDEAFTAELVDAVLLPILLSRPHRKDLP